MAVERKSVRHTHTHNTVAGWRSFEHEHPWPDGHDGNQARPHEHSNGRHSHPHGHSEYVRDLPEDQK